jgi:hypothetical protein
MKYLKGFGPPLLPKAFMHVMAVLAHPKRSFVFTPSDKFPKQFLLSLMHLIGNGMNFSTHFSTAF